MKLSDDKATHQGAEEQLENDENKQEAVSQEEVEQTTEEPIKSAREIAMEAIAAQRSLSLANDGVDISDKNEVKTDEKDLQLANQLAQDEKPVSAPEAMLVKVKVDGNEVEIPLSEVVKSYQKDSAASKRLQEATRLLQYAEQQAEQIAKNASLPDNNAVNQPDNEQDKETRRGKIKDAFSKLYEGDEDGAVEAMLQIVGDQGVKQTTQIQQPIDTAAIAAQVRQQLDVESAYKETRLDYPELFSDTERGIILGRETVERMAAKESEGMTKAEALQKSAEEVAALFGVKKSGRQTEEKQSTARDTKLERKANLDIPRSVNVVAGNKQSPAEAPNVSSIIAEMAKSRLGQSLSVN